MIKLSLTSNGQTIEATYGTLAELTHDEVTTLLELRARLSVGVNTVTPTVAAETTTTTAPEEPASDGQKKYMRDLGITFDSNITKAEATALLRRRLG